MIRHSSRHVQATVMNLVKARMTTLGWADEATLPFGPQYSAPIQFTDAPSIAGEGLAGGTGPGTVSCTLGAEDMPEDEELGGPLARQDYPLFFDLFQPSSAASTALANDIRDTLLGRFPGSRRHISIINQITGAPIPGWTCELEAIEIVRPQLRLPVHWQVVKVTAACYFLEEQW